jgi:hypothetical protein
VEFWIKADDTTKKILGLNSTQYVEVSSGAITATGWTSPSIYVDGVSTTTIDTNWHHVVITTNTGINASTTNFGIVGAGYFDGKLDEVKFYSRALSQTEIRYHYNRGGPVAYWKFNEGQGMVAYDTTDNNNDGIISGTTWASGKYGSALSFDGVNDSVDVPHSSNLCPESITVSGWIKPISDGTRHILLAKWFGYTVEVNSDGTVKWGLNGAGGTQYFGTKKISFGEWHYLVGTFDAVTKKQTVYIDGNFSEEQITTAGITHSVSSLIISYAGETNGLIDDVRIYNYVRTPDQIKLDYNQGYSTYFK